MIPKRFSIQLEHKFPFEPIFYQRKWFWKVSNLIFSEIQCSIYSGLCRQRFYKHIKIYDSLYL